MKTKNTVKTQTAQNTVQQTTQNTENKKNEVQTEYKIQAEMNKSAANTAEDKSEETKSTKKLSTAAYRTLLSGAITTPKRTQTTQTSVNSTPAEEETTTADEPQVEEFDSVNDFGDSYGVDESYSDYDNYDDSIIKYSSFF